MPTRRAPVSRGRALPKARLAATTRPALGICPASRIAWSAREQRLERARLRQPRAEGPDRLRVRRPVREAEAGEASWPTAGRYQGLGPGVGQVVRRLEHRHRIKRRRAAPRSVATDKRGVPLWPDRLETHNRGEGTLRADPRPAAVSATHDLAGEIRDGRSRRPSGIYFIIHLMFKGLIQRSGGAGSGRSFTGTPRRDQPASRTFEDIGAAGKLRTRPRQTGLGDFWVRL